MQCPQWRRRKTGHRAAVPKRPAPFLRCMMRSLSHGGPPIQPRPMLEELLFSQLSTMLSAEAMPSCCLSRKPLRPTSGPGLEVQGIASFQAMSDYGQHSREGLCRRKTGSIRPSFNGGAASVTGQAAQEDEVPDLEVFRELCLSTDSAL